MFEDENEAAKYCDLMQGGGQGCEGVAEIEASSVRITTNLFFKRTFQMKMVSHPFEIHLQVFDLCQKMRALAVLFRRGRTPPMPENLKLNLRARKRSLEDQDGLK